MIKASRIKNSLFIVVMVKLQDGGGDWQGEKYGNLNTPKVHKSTRLALFLQGASFKTFFFVKTQRCTP